MTTGETIKKKRNAPEDIRSIIQSYSVGKLFYSHNITEASGYSALTVRNILKRLVELGDISVDTSQKPYLYEVL